MMRALLTADGHLVTAADNGAEAVALAARDRFDAILMDVRMPVMDGIEATRRIRMLPGEAGVTPIIAISADVMPETTRTCLAAGMSAMLAKPIERDCAGSHPATVGSAPLPAAGSRTSTRRRRRRRRLTSHDRRRWNGVAVGRKSAAHSASLPH